MKLRILDPGFANLTGLFGTVEFVDGLSVEDVSKAEAARLGTILAIEIEGTGVNPSTTQLMVDLHNKNMDDLGLVHVALLTPEELPQPPEPTKEEEPADKPQVVVDTRLQQDFEVPADSKLLTLDWTFTEADLDALVKKEGIAGLRAFAEPYDINDRSVAGLIKKLLDEKNLHSPVKQIEPERVADAVETPAEEASEPAHDEPTDEELDDLENDLDHPETEVKE